MKNIKLRKHPVPLSLRPRHRYLLVELIPEKELRLTGGEVHAVLSRHFEWFFGVKGLAFNGLSVIKVDAAALKAVIKCVRGFEDEAKSSLLFLDSINKVKVIAFASRASGTIKSLL
ncbi:hypothetical protein HZB89_00255 [archaeon]|nr:hypothetical protein [archaeon]